MRKTIAGGGTFFALCAVVRARLPLCSHEANGQAALRAAHAREGGKRRRSSEKEGRHGKHRETRKHSVLPNRSAHVCVRTRGGASLRLRCPRGCDSPET